MSMRFSTNDLPAGERFEFMREAICQVWAPMEVRSDHQDDYRAQVRSNGLGAVLLSAVQAQPVTVTRTPRLIGSADPDLLKVIILVRGQGDWVVTQDDRQAKLEPGDFTLYDMTRPFELVYESGDGAVGEAMNFMFPRSLLQLPRAQVGRLTAVPMSGSTGIGTLASRFLMQLAQGIDNYGPAEAARLATAALDVLAARLMHEVDERHPLPSETHKRALLAQVQAFAHGRLGDPDLSPSMIAAAHHVSLRSLQTLFQEHGMTVAGWIRKRRLEGARGDLADAAQTGTPVAAIAARWGFSSAAHFTQVFKAVHGMPPRDYRQQAFQAGSRGS